MELCSKNLTLSQPKQNLYVTINIIVLILLRDPTRITDPHSDQLAFVRSVSRSFFCIIIVVLLFVEQE